MLNTKNANIYTFNLETLEWSSVHLKNSPEILENTSNYAILPYLENQFVLFGCYKTFVAARTNNLFSQSQEATLNSILGFIEIRFSNGQLTLEWKQNPTTGLPYLENFSTHCDHPWLTLFGGYDQDGNISNEFYQISLSNFQNHHSASKINRKRICEEAARLNHGSCFYSYNRSILVFGGEDQDSNEINDMWKISYLNGASKAQCVKLHKQTMIRRPKLGTPSVQFRDCVFYIGKSSSEVIAPIRSYLCIEEFYEEPKNQTQTYSSKKHLPFDGIPHTFEVVKDKLVLGYESSLYTIRIQEKNEAWSVDDNFGIKPFDSDDVSLVKRRKEASFKDHIRQYFVERPCPDITFKVQDQEITAHKGILSVRSRYFYELFTNEAKDKDLKNPIEISDLSPTAFNILLEWLYCNSILKMKDEAALGLFKAAEKYLVPKLKEEAEKSLVKNLTLENVIDSAKFAVEQKAKDLESAVVRLAVKEIDTLRGKEEFDQLPSSVIEKILKSGK